VATRHGLRSGWVNWVAFPHKLLSEQGELKYGASGLICVCPQRPPWAPMMDPQIDSPSRLRWTSCPASLNWLNLHGIVLSDPARRAAHRGLCGRFGRPLALVGISRGDFLRGVPAGRYRVDRRGLRLPQSARPALPRPGSSGTSTRILAAPSPGAWAGWIQAYRVRSCALRRNTNLVSHWLVKPRFGGGQL
jgi:hypothetical protein